MKRIIKLLSLLGLYIVVTLGCEDSNKDLLPSLELGQSKYEVTASQQEIDIKVQTTGQILVISNANWITASVVDSSFVHLVIAGYDDLERDRIGTVDVKLLNSEIVRTIIITQKYKLEVQSDRKWYSLYPEEQTFSVSVKSNRENYDVIISEEGKDWLSPVESADTKAITEKTLIFAVKENESSQSRYAEIVLSIREGNETDTIHVEQFGSNNMYLPYLLGKDSKCRLFFQALSATTLRDTLEQYLDPTYPGVGRDSTMLHYEETGSTAMSISTSFEQYQIVWPEIRQFKYTLFVVPDSILRTQYGINDLDDLRSYAENIYPEGAGLPDNDRLSSLNQLISYHILPCALSYEQLNTRQTDIVNNYVKWDEYDIEDFYETLLPHSIMRISTPKGAGNNPLGIYINRKGTVKNGLEYGGIRIATSSEYEVDGIPINTNALNGLYHYVDGLLLYNDDAKRALCTRIRVQMSTLSPDFINSGAHGQFTNSGNVGSRQLAYNFKKGFCKNVYYDPQNTWLTICPRYKYYPLGEQSFMRGVDVAFKLPPVPYDATYEIRLLNWNLNFILPENKTITQFSLFESDSPNPSGDFTTWDWTVCGDAVDLKKKPELWMHDDDIVDIDNIRANDNALRESGYMKGMDTYTCDSDETLRNDSKAYRIIVSKKYMYSNLNYYLRIQVIDADDYDIYIPCIELAPKEIYAGLTPEDWH